MRGKKSYEKNNFQDNAETREYNKGRRAAGSTKFSGKRRRQGARERSFDYNPEISRVTEPVTTSAKNDAFWYNPDDNIFNGVAGITTQAANGLPVWTGCDVPVSNEIGSTGQFIVQTKGIKSPGVMVFDVIPSIGISTKTTDPYNRASDTMFTFIRQNKSGQPIYEAPNLGMYIFAIANAYAFYEYICRIYGTMKKFSALDWYTPEALITAMNVDFQDIKSNLADFRNWINFFCSELQKFDAPSGMYVHDRYKFLFSNIFLDEATQKAQYYLFNPAGFWIWAEGTSDNPRHPVTTLTYKALTTVSPQPVPLTFAQLQAYGEAMLAPLSSSQDVRNMSADIFTVFGAGNLLQAATIGETYQVQPTHDIRAQQQIENMFIYGDTDTFVGTMYEDTGINAGYIINSETLKPSAGWIQQPHYGSATGPSLTFQNIQPAKWLLNFHQDSISHEDIMEATRLAGFGYTTGVDEDSPLEEMNLSTHGSEFIAGARIFYYTYDPYALLPNPKNLVLTSHAFDTMFYFNATNVSGTYDPRILPDICDVMSLLSKFDWHPQVFMTPYNWVFSAATPQYIQRIWRQDALLDISNFAELTAWQLEQMNHAALLAEFTCRTMGEYSRIIQMK